MFYSGNREDAANIRKQRRVVLRCLCAVVAGAFLLKTAVLAAREQIWIAKSTFMYLEDARTRKLDKRSPIYLPAGTTLIAQQRTERHRGWLWRQVLTEHGLWGYITDATQHYWPPEDLGPPSESGRVAYVRGEPACDARVDLAGSDRSISVPLRQGETYDLINEFEDTVEISIGSRTLGDIVGTGWPAKVSRECVSIIDIPAIFSVAKEIRPFKRHIKDGVAGIQKPCGTKQASAIKIGGEGGFSLKKFFVGLGFSVSSEVKWTEDLPKDLNVTREYYKRDGGWGTYRVTRFQKCGGGREPVWYSIVAPGNLEKTVDEKWAAEIADLTINKETGEVLVSCPKQYFEVRTRLARLDFDEDDLPFIISKIACFRGIQQVNKCDHGD